MVTVIIPSYNRAHILRRTIPTYLQDGVDEIIIVDDCSTDDTKLVVEELMLKIDKIKYIRLESNKKQVFAKNVGINNTTSEWIYFGDDDSVLIENSIKNLMKTAITFGADIVGARALYMGANDEEIEKFLQQQNKETSEIKDIVDLRNFKTDFTYIVDKPVEVPFTQASALVKTKLAKSVLFDENYKGNCYREETDFFLRCKFAGAKILYDSSAVQINLPRKIATGGAHSSSKIKWYLSTIKNNFYFLKKNKNNINSYLNTNINANTLQIRFIAGVFYAGLLNLLNRFNSK